MYSDKYTKMAQEGKFDYNKQSTKEYSEKTDLKRNLPPLESWLNTDITAEELHKMGYSYLEMMELGNTLW